jgi:hypothetical protein
MIEKGVVVRVGCARCRTFFDVDLIGIARARGPDYCLIDRTTQCKVTRCRGRGYFIAASSMVEPIITLTNASMDPFGLNGLRPIDLEPSDPPSGEPVEQLQIA